MVEDGPYTEGPVKEELEEGFAKKILDEVLPKFDTKVVEKGVDDGESLTGAVGEGILDDDFERIEEISVVEGDGQTTFSLHHKGKIARKDVETFHDGFNVETIGFLHYDGHLDVNQLLIVK